MKKFLFAFLLFSIAYAAASQDMKKFSLYKPEENAGEALANAVMKAKKSGKHVFVQIGGNWCVWCARFHEFTLADKKIDSVINANYIVYHMNYSTENRNPNVLAKLDYPQRFGFPVFLIIDGNGKRLHTQNSAYLEEDKGYNREKVIEFFQHWSPKALDPGQYKKY